MKNHKCADCKFMHTFFDSSHREIAICVFDQSDSYLQEVGYCTEDCELDDYAEEIWCERNGDILKGDDEQ